MEARKRFLVTGAAGFIGSALAQMLASRGCFVVAYDKLTYAGSLSSLAAIPDSNLVFVRGDICDTELVYQTLVRCDVDAVFHLAAESHVDRSINGPAEFIRTNINGTFSMLVASERYYRSLAGDKKSNFRFLHVSTDEVYGSLDESGYFTEDTPYAPNSPYSASKAAADHLVHAWHSTYGFPTLMTNCSNNYGPRQYPEKLIPLMIERALAGAPLPVYGDGGNVRDWLYVDDHCNALCTVMSHGAPGERYNIGGNCEKRNIDIVNMLCAMLDRFRPRPDGLPYSRQITFVTDRPGHDRRYAIDASKLRRELSWRPRTSFEDGLAATVRWYLDNEKWCREMLGKDS